MEAVQEKGASAGVAKASQDSHPTATSVGSARFAVHAAPTIGMATMAAGGLMAAGLLPLLLKFFADLWTRPQYEFFPLVLIGAAYLAWDRLSDVEWNGSAGESRPLGAALLSMALLLLATGVLFYTRWFAALAAWVAVAGAIWWVGGARLARALTPSLVLLAVIIPPPMRLDEALALKLRSWAVWASGRVLDLLHIPHVTAGTLINIAGHRLGIEEACSGINSLMAVLAVTLMLGFWWRRRGWHIALLAGVSIVFVTWANVLRIVIGALLQDKWQIDILSGSAHALLGLVLFLVCVALVASFDQFLMALQRPGRPPKAQERSSPPPALRYTASPPGGVGWALAVGFAAMGVVAQARVGNLWQRSRLPADAQFTLPASIDGWARVEGSEQVIGRPELLGQHSTIWSYRNGDLTAMIGFDYPFPGFHDLDNCYAASGWAIRTLNRQGAGSGSGPAGSWTEERMDRRPSAYACLLFSLCDEQGNWLAPNPPLGTGLAMSMKLSRDAALAAQAYQVQVLVQGFQPLTPSQEQRVGAFFLAAREQLSSQLVAKVAAQ